MADCGPQCSCERVHPTTDDEPSRCSRFAQWEALAKMRGAEKRQNYAGLLEASYCGETHIPYEKERELMIDVERTCSALNFFAEGGSGRIMLAHLLRAWVVYDAQSLDEETLRQSIGYVQGMNFIATTLLWHCGREECAFWLFVAMMEGYGLRCMFQAPDMFGLKMRSFTMTQLLHHQMPDVSDHLAEYLRNSLSLLLTEWLLTLFANSVPLVPLAEFWDSFFEHGYYSVYRLILARLRCLRPWLLAETDFVGLVHLVKEVHVEFDICAMKPTARVATPISTSMHGSLDSGILPGAKGSVIRRTLVRRLTLGVIGGRPKRDSVQFPLIRFFRSNSGTEPAETIAESFNESDIAPVGAWTCMTCNGSESCRSWGTIINMLLAEEHVSDSTIAGFEAIFSASSSARRPSSDLEAPDEIGNNLPQCGEPPALSDLVISPRSARLAKLEADNQLLHQEHLKLKFKHKETERRLQDALLQISVLQREKSDMEELMAREEQEKQAPQQERNLMLREQVETQVLEVHEENSEKQLQLESDHTEAIEQFHKHEHNISEDQVKDDDQQSDTVETFQH